MRPMATLERNSVVQSFLTVVVNSYWTLVLYVKEAVDIDVHLEDATAYTVEHLGALLDRQILGASKFMDLVRRSQDESGHDPGAYSVAAVEAYQPPATSQSRLIPCADD